MTAIDRNAADFLQKPANARLEEFLLDHHLELDAVIPIVGQADKEILNGGMWRHNADGIAKVLWGLVDGLPTAKAKPQFTYLFFYTHDYQMVALSSGAIYILLPSGMSKAS